MGCSSQARLFTKLSAPFRERYPAGRWQLVDRPAIGRIVFSDEKERRWLDDFTHPVILAAVKARLAEARAAHPPAVLLDVPLLLEAGWDRLADETWLIALPHEVQVQRLMVRNGYSRMERKRALPRRCRWRRSGGALRSSSTTAVRKKI